MGKLFMTITTLSVLLIIIILRIHNKSNFKAVRIMIREVNSHYLSIFHKKSKLGKFMQAFLLIFAQLFMVINIISGVVLYVDTKFEGIIDIAIKGTLITIGIIAVYLVVGYMLLMSSRVYDIFHSVEDKNMKSDLLLSYFILSTYFTVLIVLPKQFEESYFFGLIGVSISYLLNLRILIKIIRNPKYIKSHDKIAAKSTTVISILILIMIVLNLFLGVCFINSMEPGAYTGNPTKFDLFYYTIITFTTIGYGDISPVSSVAKLMSILIAITSVICLTIFIGSVLSYKESDVK